MGIVKNPEELGILIGDIVESDREAVIVVDGFKGEGKSALMNFTAVAVANHLGTPFTLHDNMTWLRSELKQWIDPGEKQKQELSAVIADELISMFYGREWFDAEQNDAIKLLNMCRDRHLAIFGAVPNFWELDKNFRNLVRFWIHIDTRSVAWMFEQTKNPGSRDKWCQRNIEKTYDKYGKPNRAKNFVCSITWPDWTPEQKKDYYAVRAIKRIGVEDQRKKPETYKKIKDQRNSMIRYMANHKIVKIKQLAEIVGLTASETSRIANGMR